MTALALDVQRHHLGVMAKTTRKKVSGRNIADSERNTIKVTLRLPPEVAEDLREFAEEYDTTMARVVEAAMMMVGNLQTLDDDSANHLWEEFVGDLREGSDLDALAAEEPGEEPTT